MSGIILMILAPGLAYCAMRYFRRLDERDARKKVARPQLDLPLREPERHSRPSPSVHA